MICYSRYHLLLLLLPLLPDIPAFTNPRLKPQPLLSPIIQRSKAQYSTALLLSSPLLLPLLLLLRTSRPSPSPTSKQQQPPHPALRASRAPPRSHLPSSRSTCELARERRVELGSAGEGAGRGGGEEELGFERGERNWEVDGWVEGEWVGLS